MHLYVYVYAAWAVFFACFARSQVNDGGAQIVASDGNVVVALPSGRSFSIECPDSSTPACVGPEVHVVDGLCKPVTVPESVVTETVLSQRLRDLKNEILAAIDVRKYVNETALEKALDALPLNTGVQVVDSLNADCAEGDEGQVRYNRANKQLQVCNGQVFKGYSSPLGTAEKPAASCQDLKLAIPDAESGVYQIGKPTQEVSIFCDLSSDVGTSLGGNGASALEASPDCETLATTFGFLSGVFWIGADPASAVLRYCEKDLVGNIQDRGSDGIRFVVYHHLYSRLIVGSSARYYAFTCEEIGKYWNNKEQDDMSGIYWIGTESMQTRRWCDQLPSMITASGI